MSWGKGAGFTVPCSLLLTVVVPWKVRMVEKTTVQGDGIFPNPSEPRVRMSGIYFPDERDAVPAEAGRCKDASRPDGRCRFSAHCSHQVNHQRIAGHMQADVLATCPWIPWFRQRVGYELPEVAP